MLRTWCAFAHFDFVNVLHATTECTFSTSQLPKVLRCWGAFSILTWKCASRHDGVHFLNISTFKNYPALACFVHFNLEMCFAPRRRAIFHLSSPRWLRTCRFSATKHWKNRVFRDFSTFSPICIFFLWLFLFSDLLSSSLLFSSLPFPSLPFPSLLFSSLLFSSLTLPTSAFSSVHIVGSLTCKLPPRNYLTELNISGKFRNHL